MARMTFIERRVETGLLQITYDKATGSEVDLITIRVRDCTIKLTAKEFKYMIEEVATLAQDER